MTIYLAGGIPGDENYKERIAAAKRMLLRESEDQLDSTAWYYGSPRADTVLSPAELPAGWPGKVYMDVCLAMIRAADLVAFLPGWEQSRWASLEMEYSWHQIKPGDKILDTHLGSGSSRRAAYDFGLDFTGIEIDPEYFAKQEAACAEYTAQERIF